MANYFLYEIFLPSFGDHLDNVPAILETIWTMCLSSPLTRASLARFLWCSNNLQTSARIFFAKLLHTCLDRSANCSHWCCTQAVAHRSERQPTRGGEQAAPPQNRFAASCPAVLVERRALRPPLPGGFRGAAPGRGCQRLAPHRWIIHKNNI